MENRIIQILDAKYELSKSDFFPNTFQFETETPRYRFTTVICQLDPTSPVIVTVSRDGFDISLCRQLLLFLSIRSSMLSTKTNYAIFQEFSASGFPFDSVLVLSGTYYQHFEHLSNSLNNQTLAAFPIARYEFIQDASPEEITQIRHGACTVDWFRTPRPYVSMRFRLVRQQAESEGSTFWYSDPSYVEYMINEMSDDGSWVDVKNFLGEIARLKRLSTGLTCSTGSIPEIDNSSISEWLMNFLTRGLAAC